MFLYELPAAPVIY